MSAPSGTTKKKPGQVSKRNDDRLLAENARLRAELKKRTQALKDSDEDLPPLPDADQNGHYPAIKTARVIIARQVNRARKSAGWSQAELARQAGIRQDDQPH
jgi:ribosome-binding protein aMBF1 (putative translation factor)